MRELFRDTVLGHALRLVSGQKILPYAEDEDPSLWKRYIDKEKSGHMAHHGAPHPEDKDAEKDDVEDGNGNGANDGSSSTRHNTGAQNSAGGSEADTEVNEVSGVKVDPEKGRDVSIVTWYSDDDPEVSSLFHD